MKARLKTNGVIIVCVILLILIFPAAFLRHNRAPLDRASGIFGVAFIILGQLLRVSGRGFKSEHSREGRSLVKGGPYGLVRNPMYLGILLVGLGMILLLFQWWVLLIFLLIFGLRYISLIFTEEKKLEAEFSQEFQDYKRRVPRIIPSLPMMLKKDIAEYLPVKFPWLKKEIGTIVTVLFIALVLESWQEITYCGMKIYLKEIIAISSVIALFGLIIGYLIKRTPGR